MLSNATSEYNVDAQVILAELDRSLRSPAIGDQCEAIVRVPQLFQRHPFPILINSAALKLAEVYRNGTNFLRILILDVMKESEKHLDKILNIEEFVRHLFAVSYANDPQARSITLQTLGSIARIVANNQNIHHFIRKSLDSVDELEVNSAIEASVKFAIQSKDFAQNIYPKIISMIEGLATSMSIKIRLLEVINNLHHNFAIAEDARNKLISFLAKYPEKNFVCEDLHTMTSIAASSITHIPEQVKLLLEYYTNDPRTTVKLSVLDDLKFLARESAHLWEHASVAKFVDIIFANLEQNSLYLTQNTVEHKELRLLCKALGVLSEFFASPAIFIDDSLFLKAHIVKIVNFCTQIIYQTSTRALFAEELQIDLVSNCFNILTNICLHVDSKIYKMDVLKETCCAYESFFLSKLIADLDHHCSGNQNALRTILRSMVTLCRTHSSTSSAIVQVTESLRFVFLRCKLNSPLMELFCEAICALAPVVRANKSLIPTDILDMFKSRQSKKKIVVNNSVNIKLYVIFFQLKIGSVISAKETQTLLNGMVKCNYWVCYKVVREAMRFGHHNFASTLLNHIKPGTEPIENTYFWINSLAKITKAEGFLFQDDVMAFKESDLLAADLNDNKFEQQLLAAISTYTEGLTHLKASVSSSKPMRFQCEFIKFRLKYLQSHQHFRQCCQLLQTSPPPSTAPSGVNQSSNFSDDSIRYGRIVSSMHKCAQEFRALAESYSLLYQSSFDADPNTLANLQLLQHSCTILAELVENLFRASHRLNSLHVPSHNLKDGKQMKVGVVEHQELEELCSTISELVQGDQLLCLSRVDPKQSSSSEQLRLMTMFTNQIDTLLRISKRMLVTPLSFPRYFFQAVQSTNIKLELGSLSRNKEKDKVTIHQNIQFVLNVEGVVNKKQAGSQPIDLFSRRVMYSHSRSLPATVIGRNPSLSVATESKVFRKVSKILLTLTTSPAMSENTTLHQMHSIVVPTHDYFQTQFLLTLPTLGFYTITVETSIIDENEAQWKSGPVQSISARVIEDYRPM